VVELSVYLGADDAGTVAYVFTWAEVELVEVAGTLRIDLCRGVLFVRASMN
jgi:hypothetical protein